MTHVNPTEDIATSYAEAQVNALINAQRHLVELIKIFEADGCLDDYDFEEVAETVVQMEIAFPQVKFEATLEDNVEEYDDLMDDEEALTSAGRGMDESYGEPSL
jgi:hypothetical protein